MHHTQYWAAFPVSDLMEEFQNIRLADLEGAGYVERIEAARAPKRDDGSGLEHGHATLRYLRRQLRTVLLSRWKYRPTCADDKSGRSRRMVA